MYQPARWIPTAEGIEVLARQAGERAALGARHLNEQIAAGLTSRLAPLSEDEIAEWVAKAIQAARAAATKGLL